MFLSRGAYEPKDYHRREYWTWKPAGEKPWIFRMFTKGRFWEDERRKKRRSSGGEGVGDKQHDAFEMSEVDVESMRTSRIATSFAASSSSQRVSGMASSSTNEGSQEGGGGMTTSREGELHEMPSMVVPQQTVVVVPHV